MTIDKAITLFSFGYWGWGNSTRQLILSFDALEQNRGYNPPLLVDIRISRSVRAPGFNSHALEKLVGTDRYVHMPDLGNLAVIHQADTPTIKNPAAAGDLLDLAISEHKRTRRIVFFCACPFQLQHSEPYCHRYEVGSLLLERARKSGKPIIVTEWPGTQPSELRFTLGSDVLKKLRRGMKRVPIPRDLPLEQIASITWGSVVRCDGPGESYYARVDRAMWGAKGWYLPVLETMDETAGVVSPAERRAWGFVERRSES